MQDINLISLTGRATAAAAPHNDGGIAKFSIACNRSYRTDDGSFTDEVSYFDCVAFSGLAGLILRKLRKGDSITLAGRLKQERWENAEGERRSRVVVIVNQATGEFVFRPQEEPPADAQSKPDSLPQPELPLADPEPKRTRPRRKAA